MSKMNEKKSLMKKFNQGIENALKEDNDKENITVISHNLLELFENLIVIYVSTNNWTEFFGFLDKIEAFFKKASSEKCQILRQHEYYRLLGNVFYEINKELFALDFYNRSLKLSKNSNLLAMESFENLVNSIIDRWHYRMINDRIRNEAYQKAIKKKLSSLKEKANDENVRVLDIGSGFGLLSAICLAEAQEIFTHPDDICILSCDMNQIMNEISQVFLGSFNLSKSIKILNKHSNDLSKDDFGNKSVQLVITEIFDDGLLGEGCLDTFYNALVVNKLLDTQTSVIPHSARIHVCGIESEYLRKMTSYNEVFKFKSVNAFCLDNAKEFSNNSAKEEFEFAYEPYTTENIQNIQFTLLTECIQLDELYINFTDPMFLEKICKHNETLTVRKKLKVEKSGRLDAFLIWFDLHLDEEIILTNSPFFSPNSDANSKYKSKCWNHALFTVQNEMPVIVNQEIDISVSLSKECVLVLNHGSEKFEINADETNLTLSRYEIGMLNNREYQEFYTNWLENVFKNFPINQSSSKSYLRIGYLSNTFNKCLFLLILEYHDRFKVEKNVELFIDIFLSNHQEETYDGFVMNLKNVFLNKYEFIETRTLNGDLKAKTFNLDFLICEPLDFKFGILRKNILTDLHFIKNLNQKDVEIFPSSIQLNGVFTESFSLMNESELISDENLCINQSCDIFKNLKLREILSNYRTKHLYSISPDDLRNAKKLAEICQIEKIDLNYIESLIINEGRQHELCIEITECGRLDAFIYFYELYDKNKTNLYNPLRNGDIKNILNNFGAIAFYERIQVDRKTKANFEFSSRNGFFNLEFKKFL